MKLRNVGGKPKHTAVAIRENVVQRDNGPKRNTYDLIINVGKGKKRALLLAHAVRKFLIAAKQESAE